MSRLIKIGSCVLGLAMASCGPLEIRISKEDGVKPINRTFTANVNGGNFQCGDTIVGEDSANQYVVHTQRVEGGCKFTFDQNVEIIGPNDYKDIKKLNKAVRYVDRVEIEVKRFDFYDDTGDRFDVETRVREMEFWVNGTQVLDREKIGNLPTTFTVEGEGLEAIKRAVKNRESCSVHIQASVTILDESRPSNIRCEVESQPTIILSSSEL
jgi:hypothetical protein